MAASLQFAARLREILKDKGIVHRILTFGRVKECGRQRDSNRRSRRRQGQRHRHQSGKGLDGTSPSRRTMGQSSRRDSKRKIGKDQEGTSLGWTEWQSRRTMGLAIP